MTIVYDIKIRSIDLEELNQQILWLEGQEDTWERKDILKLLRHIREEAGGEE